jgi:hypothetical protein
MAANRHLRFPVTAPTVFAMLLNALVWSASRAHASAEPSAQFCGGATSSLAADFSASRTPSTTHADCDLACLTGALAMPLAVGAHTTPSPRFARSAPRPSVETHSPRYRRSGPARAPPLA